MALAPPSSFRARWALRLALIGYVGLLATTVLAPGGRAGVGGAGFFDLRTGSRVRAVLFALGVYVLLETVRFLPVGVLAVLSLPRPRSDRFRLLPVAAVAGAGSLIVAVVVCALEIGPPWQWPGPSDLVLPAVGCVLGVGTALVWLAGRGARRRLLLVLGATLLAVPILAGLALLAATEREPLVRDSPAVTSEEKRRLYRTLTAGATHSLSLGSHDLDLLLAWGLPVVLGEGRGAARVDLMASQMARVSLTLPVVTPTGRVRYLNIVAGARVQIDRGRVSVADPTLRLGRLVLPEQPLRWLAPVISILVQAERRVRPVLAGVESLEIDPGRARLVYRRIELPPGLLASLIWGTGSNEDMRLAVRSHVERLLEAAPSLPRGEPRLGAAVEVAFAHARVRSATSPPVLENRAALLALGLLLGHRRLEGFVGPVIGERDWRRAAPLGRTTLRGREDWTKHFFVSAALTVLSAQAPSDAIGVFKEELDAGGGSGFSFGDLLADRAGTTFALLATRDAAAARTLQERLAAGFRVDDFFPEAADLPENIQAAELEARYGGVGGPLFRQYVAEVERRLWSCPAYRALAPAAATN
ncbi:MAG TPA: hypothetical protein VL086_13405 [Candidatus Nitrosotalea sp.]|nr:hypothetical protein [Candidatus Nitrosotalea sp.]